GPGWRRAKLIERYALAIAAALSPLPVSRVVAEDLAHGPGGEGHEVRLTGRPDRLAIGQFQVGLVHERGRVQRVVAVPSPALPAGERAELAVEQLEQGVDVRPSGPGHIFHRPCSPYPRDAGSHGDAMSSVSPDVHGRCIPLADAVNRRLHP